MRRLLTSLVLATLTLGCANTEPPPDPEPIEFFQSPASTERPEPPDTAEHTATATADGDTVHQPPPPPPPPAPPANDGVPSIEEQIQQCIAQTGLTQACRDKIEHGIVE